MTPYRYLILLWFIGFGQAFAQSIYQGTQPETLATTDAEKTFLATFTLTFKTDFDTPAQYTKLAATGLDAWEMSLFDARKTQLAFYKAYPQESQFSAPFKHYIEACIRWNYWHLLLAYPILRSNAQTSQLNVMSLPAIMTDELASLNVNDEAALPAEPYQNFLYFYITYVNSRARNFVKYTQADIHTSITDKAAVARKQITGQPYQYALARLLVENCEKATPASVRTVFGLLSNTPTATGYVQVVQARCGEVMARKDEPVTATKKKPADPNALSFTNQNGEVVTLNEFAGKVIYLDVWASWCGPCRAEFPFSKQLQERLTKKQKEQVVFLYLSIDDSEEAWKKALNTLQLPGEHGLSKGGWNSRTVQYFGIRSIPRYLLIGKKGNVVDENAKRPSQTDAILQDILKLVAE
ncbi:TlpA family protein disulfide reductase [Spirosoma fluviale]|uniref:Thiol-disulfide isomerase or thioredoxin n=1 Tax=Spirosoma fluviale TaxID=1597977 RepID=A0A286FH39_9BACT|nr:TlpA disulfide reductase family protein [Spirosoma fluviale]SOD82557.1 Thiol-disulfide isomerase or thioredoxin [Spirosoma fluviale]